MARMTYEEFERMVGKEKAARLWAGADPKGTTKPKKKSKFGNVKTELDGIKFDSIKESEYYAELKLAERAGQIKEIKLQPRFTLQEKFTDLDGEHHRKVEYVADFDITYSNGRREIVDVKGHKTDVYKLKKKWFLKTHPTLRLVEV